MLKLLTAVAFLLILNPSAHAQDAFASVRCDVDIAKALVGKKFPSGRASATERRYRDIGLKFEGADVLSTDLNFASWSMCGHEYALLVDRLETIRDVLRVPLHSRRQPMTLGPCILNGKEIQEAVLAVLDNVSPLDGEFHYATTDSTLLPALSAWRIDETRRRFAAMPVGQLRCPRSSISTIDGGP